MGVKVHFRSSLSPRQSYLTGDGGIHHLAEVVNDVGLMLDVGEKERVHLLNMPMLPKGQVPYWVPKV